MKVLLIWPDSVTDYTSSDAYFQVPDQLARRFRVTLLRREGTAVPPALAKRLEASEELPASMKAFGAAAVRRGMALHRKRRFAVIVSAFDTRSLLAATILARRTGALWFPACEDHPFGERYRVMQGVARNPFAQHMHERALRLMLSPAHRILLFINPGVLVELGIKRERMVVFGNNADLARLDPIRKQSGEVIAHSLGYVGVVTEDKGALTMAHALARVRESFPDATLRLIGRPPEDNLRREMERIAPGGLEFVGQVPASAAMREAARCTVCIHAYRKRPWLWHNQVLKICEYMALERPIVSVATPGVRDLVRDGTEALLVPLGEDVETGKSLGDAALRLLRDDALARRVASAALQRAVEERNWRRAGTRLCRLIYQLAAP